MFCGQCGTKIDDEDRFCNNCGTDRSTINNWDGLFKSAKKFSKQKHEQKILAKEEKEKQEGTTSSRMDVDEIELDDDIINDSEEEDEQKDAELLAKARRQQRQAQQKKKRQKNCMAQVNMKMMNLKVDLQN